MRYLVIQITGRKRKGKYSEYAGMKSAFKIAALLLLLAFSVSTAFAALPCQFEKQSSMHCGRNCPMMAMMQDKAAGGSSNSASGISCCQKSPQPSAPAAAQSATEQFTSHAIEPDERIDVMAPSVQCPPLRIDRSNAWRIPQSRAALCTFLI